MTTTPRDAGIPVLTEVIRKEEKAARAAALAASKANAASADTPVTHPAATPAETRPALVRTPAVSEQTVDDAPPVPAEKSFSPPPSVIILPGLESQAPAAAAGASGMLTDMESATQSALVGNTAHTDAGKHDGKIDDVPELSDAIAGQMDDEDALEESVLDDFPMVEDVLPENGLKGTDQPSVPLAAPESAAATALPFLPQVSPKALPQNTPAVWSRPGQKNQAATALPAAGKPLSDAAAQRDEKAELPSTLPVEDRAVLQAAPMATSGSPVPARPFNQQKPGLPATPAPSPLNRPAPAVPQTSRPAAPATATTLMTPETEQPLLWGKPSAPPLGRATNDKSAPTSLEGLAVHAAVNWDDEEWQRLERRLRERVLGQLLGRIDTMLEQRIREVLADILQASVTTLATEIRTGLHQGMEDLVSRAVAQEISRLHTPRN